MAKRNKPSDEQGQDENQQDDSFGLPDLEYKPLDSEKKEEQPVNTSEETKPEEEPQPSRHTETQTNYTSSYMEEEEKSSKTSVIIAVVVALAVVVAGVLFYMFVYRPGQVEKDRLAKEAADLRLAEEKAAKERAAAEEAERLRKEREAAEANAAPKEGTIETLTERTKRYYVVVTSAVDGDLVMDYAKRLSAKGVSTKIIPPFGKYKFSRLAIGDYDSFASAQASADQAKAEYGGAVWVLKF